MAIMYSTWPPTHVSYNIKICSDQFMLHLEDILAGKISLQFRENTLSLLVICWFTAVIIRGIVTCTINQPCLGLWCLLSLVVQLSKMPLFSLVSFLASSHTLSTNYRMAKIFGGKPVWTSVVNESCRLPRKKMIQTNSAVLDNTVRYVSLRNGCQVVLPSFLT